MRLDWRTGLAATLALLALAIISAHALVFFLLMDLHRVDANFLMHLLESAALNLVDQIAYVGLNDGSVD